MLNWRENLSLLKNLCDVLYHGSMTIFYALVTYWVVTHYHKVTALLDYIWNWAWS